MKEFLWNVARSRVTADCLVYLMNIYGALANAADWQYKAFANPAQLTPENVKLVQDKIQKAKQEIVSQTQKFQLSACYTRVPNFAE